MSSSVSARNKRNKAKGTEFETDLMKGLREAGLDVERLRLAGKEDEGDLVVRRLGGPVVIEAKNAKFEPSVFVDEAQRERKNYAAHRGLQPRYVEGIAVVKRRGKNWRKAYVLTTVEEFFGLEPE